MVMRAGILTVLVAALAWSQPGPRSPAQIQRVNALRVQLTQPAGVLYSTAALRCGADPREEALVQALGELAGRAFVFSLVVVTPKRYARDATYRARIDRAFRRLAAAYQAAEKAWAGAPHGVRRTLGASREAFLRVYEPLAFFWSEKNRPERRLQALELEADRTTTLVGVPVRLRVVGRYRDGSRREIRGSDVFWRVRPEEGASITREFQFVAQLPGTYQVTAVYEELVSPAVVIQVRARRPEGWLPRGRLTGPPGRTDDKMVEFRGRPKRPKTGGAGESIKPLIPPCPHAAHDVRKNAKPILADTQGS